MGLIGRFLLFGSILLVLVSCRKSTSANWDVDAVVPVVNSSLNITNFAGDSLFNTDNTGLLNISLSREVAAIKLDSILKLPDTTIVQTFTSSSPFPLNLTPGQAVNSAAPSELEFDVSGGAKLKMINIRSGSITVKFSNSVSEPIDLIYKIPSATKNGNPFTLTETVPTGTNTLEKTYDLSGYSLNMRGISGNAYSTIVQTYSISISSQAAQNATVNFGQGAKVEITYTELTPDYVEGYFGQQTIKIDPDTASFHITDNFKASNFMLSQASMEFNILNEFGTEFSGSIFNTASINTEQNKVVPLVTNQLNNININRATKVGTVIYPSVKSFSFRSDNSNILPFISNLPDRIAYQGEIKVNPLGNISGYNDFAFYNTGIRILANINIPLRFTADYFLLRSKDTEVDFSGVQQLNNVNSGNFVILAKNSFPFAAQLQGYMYDENEQLLDSLFDTSVNSNIIREGQLNALNEVTAPTQSKLYVPVNKTKIDHLKRCRQIRVQSKFIMPPNPPDIKILEQYSMDVNIVAELNYRVGLTN
ncbi:MAG: hypothetical protein JNL60_12975 [Bacteroidia bacterium]|nr:hypothetical protein [Bacteroidia bacterium]